MPEPCQAEPAPCLDCGIRTAWLNLGINGVLAAVKCLIGFLADSRALVACALYSINDALSASVVLVSLRMARRPPDLDHPYGHRKAEFIAIGVVSVVLTGAVVFYLVYVLRDLLRGASSQPHVIALLVALVTGVTNYYLARAQGCAGTRLGSPALHTAAEHNRSDAISSGLAMIGIAGAMVGLGFLDPLVAVIETVDVMRLSGGMLGSTLRELMDTSLPAGERERVSLACRAVPGVLGLLELRTRRSGSQRWVDATVSVAAELSTEAASAVVAEVRRAIAATLPAAVETQVQFRAATALPGRPHA